MDDLFINDLERKFGDTGYAFWFKTLELIASQGEDGKLKISLANYQKKLHKRRTVVERLLNFCSTFGKLQYEIVDEYVIIKCKKFAELADNYTKYDGVSTKRLQRQKEMSTKQEGEEEVDKKKIIDRARPQSLDEIKTLFKDRNYPDADNQAERFLNHYTANGWKVGRNPMKDWKAAAANWNKNVKEWGNNVANNKKPEPTSPYGARIPCPRDCGRMINEASKENHLRYECKNALPKDKE